jgi:hypothetical protein
MLTIKRRSVPKGIAVDGRFVDFSRWGGHESAGDCLHSEVGHDRFWPTISPEHASSAKQADRPSSLRDRCKFPAFPEPSEYGLMA